MQDLSTRWKRKNTPERPIPSQGARKPSLMCVLHRCRSKWCYTSLLAKDCENTNHRWDADVGGSSPTVGRGGPRPRQTVPLHRGIAMADRCIIQGRTISLLSRNSSLEENLGLASQPINCRSLIPQRLVTPRRACRGVLRSCDKNWWKVTKINNEGSNFRTEFSLYAYSEVKNAYYSILAGKTLAQKITVPKRLF